MPSPIAMARALVLSNTQRAEILRTWPAERRALKQSNDLHTANFWRLADDNSPWAASLAKEMKTATDQINAANKDAAAFEDLIRRALEQARSEGKITPADVTSTGLGAFPLLAILAIVVVAILAISGPLAFAYAFGSPEARAKADATNLRIKAQIAAHDRGAAPQVFTPLPGESPAGTVPATSIPQAVASIGSFGVIAGAIVLLVMFMGGGRR